MPLDSEIHRRHRDELGLSSAALAELTNIHKNRLGAYLSGVGQLSGTEMIKIENTLSDLDTLVRIAAPFTPSFQSVVRTRDLLARLHNGEFEKAAAFLP
jgi:hypothetical protein